HFGRFIVDKEVEKLSCHFEADYSRGGYSVLAIRPLLWKNDWPIVGEPFQEGVYEIESERRGYALELAVDFTRQETERRRWFKKVDNEILKPIAFQTLQEVMKDWPKGNIPVRAGDYMFRPHQKWEIKAVPNAGGYLGGPYYKIVIAGTNRALTATANKELTTIPEFTGVPEQLWRIDQLTDGTFRIMPKAVPGTTEPMVIYSIGDSTPTLAPFDANSDNSKWNFTKR
ncbi:MAG: RICIN domain-containing protein, partial [Prevotella sp.]